MITFLQHLLAKQTVKLATENSLEAVNQVAEEVYNRNSYVVKVLRAPRSTRDYVKNQIWANGGIDNSSLGQKHLWVALEIFETLSAEQKAAYIRAFINTSSVQGNGSVGVALRYVWEQNYEPPVNVP